MSNSVLKLENVTMQFGGVVAVDDLSMEVREGEIVALIGPNGAGKTTAFNVVTGVYAPTNGCLYLDGKPYLRRAPHRTRQAANIWAAMPRNLRISLRCAKRRTRSPKLGLARTFQNIRLFGNLTVFENVLIAKHMHAKGGFFAAALHLNCKEEARMRREAMELLEIVGLKELKERDRQQSALWSAAQAGDCPCAGNRPAAADSGRTGSGHEPAGNCGTDRIYPRDPGRISSQHSAH